MASILTKIKTKIGETFRANDWRVPSTRNPPPATGGVPAIPAHPPAPYPHGATVPLPLSELTPEQLKARRLAILAQVAFDVPVHRRVLNTARNIWRVIGPFCFVLFTAWEVFYFISSFMPKDGSWTTKVLLWGITLLIEVPFMMATYDMAERKAAAAEKQARGEKNTDRDTIGAIMLWLFLAAVNVCGQVAFLVLVTRVGADPFSADPRTIGLWFFIVFRVSGVLAGDAYTAFFLRPDETSVDRVLRTQEAQMRGEELLAKSDANRLRTEAETDAAIRHIKIAVDREEREAEFIEDWQKMNMQQTLERQQRFMEWEARHMRIDSVKEEHRDTGDL